MAKKTDDENVDLPAHEEAHEVTEHDGGGMTINLDELPGDDGKAAAKKPNGEDTEERQTRKGGEEREEDPDGALDALGEQESDEVRTRRREERKRRKEARRERESQLESRLEQTENELRDLRARQAHGAAQGVRATIERIEDEMRTLNAQYNEAKALKERAYNEQKGKEAVEADEAMAAARERYRLLQGQREQIVTEVEESRARPQVSPQLKNHAEKFMKENDWYDIKGGDRDSAKVLALDRLMAKEGWDPNTAGYWEELRERVREELPHHYEAPRRGRREEREEEREDDDPPPRRRQITGGTDRDAPALKPNQYYLNAERVKALKEAGMWEDPVKRAKMIKTYKKRDEQEARTRGNRR